MSFTVVGLGRVLVAMYADKASRTSILRSDIRTEIKKAGGGSSSKGGDFYLPFWTDAKSHVAGHLDLREATKARIAGNKGRARLYTLLQDGFLVWWEEKRRLKNVPFTMIDGNVKARFDAPGLGTIKVENTLSITIGDESHRIIYPYFCEDPTLSEEAARLGIWIMSRRIGQFTLNDLRMLDVIGGRTFSNLETPLHGDEESLFLWRYRQLLEDWQRLRSEYP